MKEGMVAKIRNNLYTCISGETGQPVANRFQIGCSVTPTAYISHHTAMEYYGITDQVFYDVYVSSETSFRDFEFYGYRYHYVRSNSSEGIVRPDFSGGIAITDPERTMLDSIKDMDKISGLEEVIQNISDMRGLQEKRVLAYMSRLGLSDGFIRECQSRIGGSKRYLTRDIFEGVYERDWQLVVPRYLDVKNGVTEDAAI